MSSLHGSIAGGSGSPIGDSPEWTPSGADVRPGSNAGNAVRPVTNIDHQDPFNDLPVPTRRNPPASSHTSRWRISTCNEVALASTSRASNVSEVVMNSNNGQFVLVTPRDERVAASIRPRIWWRLYDKPITPFTALTSDKTLSG